MKKMQKKNVAATILPYPEKYGTVPFIDAIE